MNEDCHSFNAKQKINYINNEDEALTELYLHLYPKSFNIGAESSVVGVLNKNKAYYNGDSEGDINIDSVTASQDVKQMTYLNKDEDILRIELASPLATRDNIELNFEYSVVIPNCNHRFGYGENTINVANFYPIMAVYDNGEYALDSYHSNGDPFYSDVANYDITITVPEAYTIASTGVEKKHTIDNGSKTVNYNAKAVRDFAFVLSDKFEMISSNIDGVEVMYYYYDDLNAEASLQTSIDSLITFEELFGDYPYSTLSVVKANFVHGGMEYPNMVLISDDVDGADYTNVIIHEIAHQWWYGVVGNNECVNSWLDEGLTEFSTLLFYEKNSSYNVDPAEIISNITKSYATFVDLYTSILGEVDTTMNRNIADFDTEPEYVYITYVKGNLLFNTLRDYIGQDKFIKGLKKYYSDNAFDIATPEDLISAMESTSGMDLTEFFNSWIDGKIKIIDK